MRIVDWAGDDEGGPAVVLLDQRALPAATRHLYLR